jgi:hypothetical protein
MTFARGLATRLYGLLFRCLIIFVPGRRELDDVMEILDGERDKRLLR